MSARALLAWLFGHRADTNPGDKALREQALAKLAAQEREIEILEAQASAVTGKPRRLPPPRRRT